MIFRCDVDSYDTIRVIFDGETIDFEITEDDHSNVVCLSLADARRLVTHVNSLLNEASAKGN